MKQYFKEFFLKTWRESEEESRQSVILQEGFSPNLKILIILVYAAVGISITRYFGNTAIFLPSLIVNPGKFGWWYCSFFFGTETGKFHSMLFWIGMIVTFYLIIPVLIIKFIFREKLSDYGFRLQGIAKDYPIYLLMLGVMLPIVFLASTTQAFQSRYPLFHPSRETFMHFFIWWELAYFLQFVAVEFFFRGFMLHGTRSRFGFYSIFIMTIPYCLVHFGKPFGETIAAIFAGIILGTLSLKSRSIILGILIHFSIAITMDVFALWRIGFFN